LIKKTAIKLEKTLPKRESRASIQTVQEFIVGEKDSPFCWQQNDHFLFYKARVKKT
jgi:hypothetical protein